MSFYAGGEMEGLEGHSTERPAVPRLPLSRDQFEQICAKAARGSTGCATYIVKVLGNLLTLLDSSGSPASATPDFDTALDNAQAAVVTLHFFIEQRCEYDFDVVDVLNSYQPDSILRGGYSPNRRHLP